MPVADLEMALHRTESKVFDEMPVYTVELRFRNPKDEAFPAPVQGSARFNLDVLRDPRTPSSAYASELTRGLFADDAVRRRFLEFCAIAFSGASLGALRLRLFIGPSAPELETLRWEMLQHPDDGRWLLTDQNLFFSRFMSGFDWRPVQLRAKSGLRALVIISSPTDLGPQASEEGAWSALAPLDVEAEKSFAQKSLKDFNPTILAKGEATVGNIFDRLREEHDIVYLVGHGALKEGEPWLILEDESGKARPVAGRDFAARMADLEHRPRLVVLASCQSAGTGQATAPNQPPAADGPSTRDDGGALVALGPRLMQVGIPAVMAMQGRILMKTVGKFMPVFFDELRKDGLIDRAMTVARGAVRDERDGWAPVLYMRLVSGRIWYVPGFSSEEENAEFWPALLTRIKNKSCTPIIGSGLLEPLVGPTHEIARRWAEKHHFPMFPSDQEDLPQVSQYLSVVQEDFYLRQTFATELLGQIVKKDKQDAAETNEEEKPEERLREVLSAAGAKLRTVNPWEPHRVLASLKVPIYITTNPDDLLADALREAGKEPQVELCRWRDDIEWRRSVFDDAGDGDGAGDEDGSYTPSVAKPLVYHLFGHLSALDSLVLTEDNYFDYLIGVSRRGKENPIPQLVRTALTNTALLFIGFKIDDWDFRVFFRSVRNQQGLFLQKHKKIKHVAVQIDPEAERFLDPERARRYLQKYFVDADIYVYWGSTEDFIGELGRRWESFVREEQQ